MGLIVWTAPAHGQALESTANTEAGEVLEREFTIGPRIGGGLLALGVGDQEGRSQAGYFEVGVELR